MAENVLEKIINKKIEKIVNLKKTISLESLDELINTNKTFINFKKKLKIILRRINFQLLLKLKKLALQQVLLLKIMILLK